MAAISWTMTFANIARAEENAKVLQWDKEWDHNWWWKKIL
jgi:hypothetical protein